MPQGEGARIQARAAVQQKPLPPGPQPCPVSGGEPHTPDSRLACMPTCIHSTVYMHMSCVRSMTVELTQVQLQQCCGIVQWSDLTVPNTLQWDAL